MNNRQKIYAALGRRPLLLRELASATGLKPETARHTLIRMRADGQVEAHQVKWGVNLYYRTHIEPLAAPPQGGRVLGSKNKSRATLYGDGRVALEECWGMPCPS